MADDQGVSTSSGSGPDSSAHDPYAADRRRLQQAQAAGLGATLKTYLALSGPGWLQSAITLGGGSLAGSLYLGVIGALKAAYQLRRNSQVIGDKEKLDTLTTINLVWRPRR